MLRTEGFLFFQSCCSSTSSTSSLFLNFSPVDNFITDDLWGQRKRVLSTNHEREKYGNKTWATVQMRCVLCVKVMSRKQFASLFVHLTFHRYARNNHKSALSFVHVCSVLFLVLLLSHIALFASFLMIRMKFMECARAALSSQPSLVVALNYHPRAASKSRARPLLMLLYLLLLLCVFARAFVLYVIINVWRYHIFLAHVESRDCYACQAPLIKNHSLVYIASGIRRPMIY